MKLELSNNSIKLCRDEEVFASELQKEFDVFSQFENKKVTIKALGMSTEMTGKIKRDPNNNKRFAFFEGKKRNSFYGLTLGYWKGCYGTITVTEIN